MVLCGTKNDSSTASLEEPFEAPLFLRVYSLPMFPFPGFHNTNLRPSGELFLQLKKTLSMSLQDDNENVSIFLQQHGNLCERLEFPECGRWQETVRGSEKAQQEALCVRGY